ncbi:chemotaxis protein CheW [Candidatus Electrothrix sp.]|uniref:chemotaxis protein CheW n=1 Tax=Candidatus Electrothrix sp. TaxID=2170559 RepID=UPI0040565F6A
MRDKKKKSLKGQAKTVALSLDAEQIKGRDPVLLFTASQIDEVLADAEVHPLPFAANHLVGLCAWREQVLPIIDLVAFFDLIPSQKDKNERYVVVRTVDSTLLDTNKDNKEKQNTNKVVLRCVLKVSNQIISGDIPTECTAVFPKQAGFAPVFLKGLFQGEKKLFLLPDLATIIHSDVQGSTT